MNYIDVQLKWKNNIIYLNIVIIHQCHDSPNEYKTLIIVEY
jgi:hypothetical protein